MNEVSSGIPGVLPYLESADAAIGKSLLWIKQQCSDGGAVSNDRLDAHQMASFDLAWCAAEATAARFAAEYAGRVVASLPPGSSACLEERMARAFCAEALQNILNRLRARPQSFGLGEADLAALASPDVTRFCQGELDAAGLEALGREVIAQDGASGAYLLGDDETMMQDAFRKLATNVVMPLAEEIHREDRIIPKEILGPLTEMGCFGLSIPERYGGMQSDDHEDNMGMIVVTEELSRGSLGAAGSLITRPEILSRALLKGGTEEQRTQVAAAARDGRSAVRRRGDRTRFRFRRRRDATQGDEMRRRLDTQRRQDLVHVGRQGRRSPGAGALQSRQLARPPGAQHVPGREGLVRGPRFRVPPAAGRRASPGGRSRPSAIAACTPTRSSSTMSSSPTRTWSAGRRAKARVSTSRWPDSPAAASRRPRAPSASCRPPSKRRFPTRRSAWSSASRSATTSSPASSWRAWRRC